LSARRLQPVFETRPLTIRTSEVAMKRFILIGTLALCCAPALARHSAAADKEEGFQALFDGKSFAGWKVD